MRIIIIALTFLIGIFIGNYIKLCTGIDNKSEQNEKVSMSVADPKATEPSKKNKNSNIKNIEYVYIYVNKEDGSNESAFAIDSDSLIILMSNLNNSEPKDKIKAIEVLSKVGSEPMLERIEAIAHDSQEDSDVRAEAVKALDWQSKPYDLLNFFYSDVPPEVLVAAIESADSLKLDDHIAKEFEDTLFAIFKEKNIAVMKVAILDFAKNRPSLLNDLLSLNRDNLSEGVINHIQEIEDNIKEQQSEDKNSE